MGRIWIVAPKDSQAANSTAAQLRAHFGDHAVEVISLSKKVEANKLAKGDVAILFIERASANQTLASSAPPGEDQWLELPHPLVLDALKSGLPLLPVLVDGVRMPAANELPPAVRELAFKHATPVRNDSRLARDLGRLVNDLESQLQEVVGRSFGYEFLASPTGFVLLAWGLFFSIIRFRNATDWSYDYESFEEFDQSQQTLFWAGPLPLGAGMLLLSLGWCWRQRRNYLAERATHYRSGQGQVPSPPSKLAAASLCFGMPALGWGLLPGLLAWGFGAIAMGRSRRFPLSRGEWRQVFFALALGLVGIYGSIFGLPPTENLGAALKVYESGRQLFSRDEDDFFSDKLPSQTILDQAAVKFQTAIQLHPSYPNAHFRLAEIYAANGRNEESLKTLNQALPAYPTEAGGFLGPSREIAAKAYQLSAEINQQLGNKEQAAKDQATAKKIAPFLDLSDMLRFW